MPLWFSKNSFSGFPCVWTSKILQELKRVAFDSLRGRDLVQDFLTFFIHLFVNCDTGFLR